MTKDLLWRIFTNRVIDLFDSVLLRRRPHINFLIETHCEGSFVKRLHVNTPLCEKRLGFGLRSPCLGLRERDGLPLARPGPGRSRRVRAPLQRVVSVRSGLAQVHGGTAADAVFTSRLHRFRMSEVDP